MIFVNSTFVNLLIRAHVNRAVADTLFPILIKSACHPTPVRPRVDAGRIGAQTVIGNIRVCKQGSVGYVARALRLAGDIGRDGDCAAVCIDDVVCIVITPVAAFIVINNTICHILRQGKRSPIIQIDSYASVVRNCAILNLNII